MTCNKKGPCKEEKAKNVEKMTDEQLDKVSGGKIGCKPSWPCEPAGKVGCQPTSTPCAPKQVVGCQPTWSPCEPNRPVGCGPTT